jgi:predicted metal-dependent phosphoesterase TrpH
MAPCYDLHTHSTASDGTLAPAALVAEAAEAGVDVLALTDHDTVNGLDEAARQAVASGIHLVPGLELSAVRQGGGIHVVGLWVDPDAVALRGLIAAQSERRLRRAETIARGLARVGMNNMLEQAHEQAGDALPTRAHFARAMVAAGHVANPGQAFKRFLRKGKVGHAPLEWPSMEEVVSIIRRSGGIAVLAHPLQYRLGRARLASLVQAFASVGGAGIEVATGNSTPDQVRAVGRLAGASGLAASAGSDYHGSATAWLRPGRLPALPGGLRRVWEMHGVAE